MKKKILAFVLLAALLLNALPVYAANAPTFRVDTVTAEAGETVEVTIWIDNNPGLASAKLVASFGSELTLTGVSFNAGLGGMSQPPQTLASPVILNWLNFMDNTNGDMYFAKLTFAVAEGAAAGTYPVTVSYDPEDVYNIDYDNIDFEVVNGGVVIEGEEEDPVVPVTGIVLDKQTMTIVQGETGALYATVEPANATNKEYYFVTSDYTIAYPIEGNDIFAVRPGTVTISAVTVDGEFVAECVVTVLCSCTYNVEEIPAKEPTCDQPGNDAYKVCLDCDKMFNAEGEEISEIPFRPATGVHTGGTATCTKLAVCATCGAEYGALGEHNYSAEVKSEETLSKAGTCSDEAVYFYSCSVCGEVEGNENHTFLGEKNAENHVGGTTLVGQSEPNHPEQISGYTGDEVCNGCGEVLVWGDEIFAGYHIAGGPLHYDEDFHWYECILDGCTAMQEITFHTPDHEGGATEEYAIKCVECGYVIEEQLDHIHDFKEIVDDQFLVSSADCENAAVYHVSCACGKAGEATFEHGAPKGHKWQDATCEFPKTCELCGATEGEKLAHKWLDATCTVAKTCELCGTTEGEALGHKPDREEPTEEESVKCTVCGEILVPAVGHTHKTEKVEAKAATCTEAGNKAYYVCKCGLWFSDAAAKKEIKDHNSVVIAALGHKWKDATCEAPKTCKVCGETEGEPIAHNWKDATCDAPKTCKACGLTEGEALGHKWVEATCETAKFCAVCNKTEGKKLGHTWVDATCTTAKTCSVCNKTEGKALGHKWTKATCEAPKTCKVCGETEGEKLDHQWKDATCTAPKTCKSCGLTEGEALGHGEIVQKSNKKQHWLACSVCGEKVADTAVNHVDENGDEKCDECDYVMVKPGNPQTGDGALSLISLTMTLSLLGASLMVLEKKKRA